MVIIVAGCSGNTEQSLHGYLEADFVDVAAEVGGRLEWVVPRGKRISRGELLFRLEQAPESMQLRQLQAQIKANEALQHEASTALELARRERNRLQKLVAGSFVSREQLDQAKTRVQQSKDRLAALKAEGEALRASLEKMAWMIERKQPAAAAAGMVEDVYFEPGEWVAPGQPVVRLLPEGALKLRFYLPEVMRAKISIGETVRLSIDGLEEPLVARIRFIASEPEFAPPVIYSEEVRTKLVYRVEAGIEKADLTHLHVGQPVDVKVP